MKPSKFEQALYELAEPVVKSMGCTLWGLQADKSGKHGLVRVYVDAEDGVNIDTCAKISRSLDTAIEVEDLIQGAYTLEVSSPGLERLFFTLEQMAAYVGREVKVRLVAPLNGQKNFTGKLVAAEEGALVVETDGEQATLPWDQVTRANLVHTF